MERTAAEAERTTPVTTTFVAGTASGATVDELANNSFTEESDDSSEGEAETEEQFWGRMMGRSARLGTGEDQPEADPSKKGDQSIMELSRVDEEEAGGLRGGSLPGTPTRPTDTRGGVMSTPATPTKGGRSKEGEMSSMVERRFQTLEQELARYKAEAGVETAIKATNSLLKEVVSGKRERSNTGQKEGPVLRVWSDRGEKAVDDLHNVFAWNIRQLVRQPNLCPEEYWSRAKYPTQIVPNLGEALYLRHMMALGVCNKALEWGHDLAANVHIKYYAHSQSGAAKKKRAGINIIDEGGDGVSRVIEHTSLWNEASSLSELVESCHNWAAIRFMVAPWDWSGFLLLRILHEVSFFTLCVESEEDQRTLMEKFVDEFLGNLTCCTRGDWECFQFQQPTGGTW